MKKFYFGLFLAGLSVFFLSCSTAEGTDQEADSSAAGSEKTCIYTVEHYEEALDGSFSETADETESLQGAESSDVLYTPKQYAGFTYDSLRTTINGMSETSDKIAADGSTVVRLYYTRNIITLTFDPSGGVFPSDFSDGVLSGRYGGTITVTQPEKTGSIFTDWNPPLPETFPSENAEYTALWDSEKYSINYNLDNGGTNGENPATYTVETDTIILTDPVRDGYTFGGWYDSADFSGTRILRIAKGSTGTITLYAKWTADTYTITFHPNKSSGTKYTQEIAYGTTQPLIHVAYERRGYTFTGWNTDPKGTGISYTDCADYAAGTADTDLYAQWEIITYDIIYILNGGINASDNPNSFTIASESIALNKPNKTGYTFDGWYTNSDCSGRKKGKISKGTADTVTLYAKWTE
ncbi:MAG: InlB B-repeat-containing protein, partial [Treponema sp.]|nr:InlB B-repeat-containing protein [Treponema sp.]